MALLDDLIEEAGPEVAPIILRAFLRDRDQCMQIRAEILAGVSTERWREICEIIVKLGDPCDA